MNGEKGEACSDALALLIGVLLLVLGLTYAVGGLVQGKDSYVFYGAIAAMLGLFLALMGGFSYTSEDNWVPPRLNTGRGEEDC